MIERFARQEAGVALPLAIIMIVLVAVMGAGLLTFVRNDLEAVVEVNQGQRAIDSADAGIQAGKRQLLSDATADATTNIYDSNTSNGNSPWSAISGGKNLTFNSNTVNVKIQYLLPSTSSSQLTDLNYAPKLVVAPATDYPEPEDYFKITATGNVGEAKRKIEAIYYTMDLGVPKGYYTPGKIEIAGSACIDSVSLFTSNIATDAVRFIGGGSGCDGTGKSIKGPDRAYGDWYKPPYNTTARSGPTCTAADGTTGMCAGVGTVGSIDYGSTTSMINTRDYDGSAGSNPKFILKTSPEASQTASEISFPFDYALPDIDFLRDEAKRQEAETGENHYQELTATGTQPIGSWPTNSNASTVVFYKFLNAGANKLNWSVPGSCSDNPPKEGMIVVENGNFSTQPNKARFRGVVVVRGGTAEGEASDTGSTCLEGFINAEGTIKIAGSVQPFVTASALKRPGFYGARLWSWRERYE